MAPEAAMMAGNGNPAGGEQGKIRAADADRDRVAGILGTAYGEGRLSGDEYEARMASALSARTYADLEELLADLPVQAAAGSAELATVTPSSKVNGFAMASLACGVGQFMVGPLATIPAIVFGHMARNRIRRTGEQGAGLALAGLVLGWGALILGVILIAVSLAAATGMHSTVPMPMPMP
jgi:hypothetical protein